MKTPEQIAEKILKDADVGSIRDISGIAEVTQMIADSIEADRAQIAQALANVSHPDSWGVPCVYVESFSKNYLGIEINVPRLR